MITYREIYIYISGNHSVPISARLTFPRAVNLFYGNNSTWNNPLFKEFPGLFEGFNLCRSPREDAMCEIAFKQLTGFTSQQYSRRVISRSAKHMGKREREQRYLEVSKCARIIPRSSSSLINVYSQRVPSTDGETQISLQIQRSSILTARANAYINISLWQ